MFLSQTVKRLPGFNDYSASSERNHIECYFPSIAFLSHPSKLLIRKLIYKTRIRPQLPTAKLKGLTFQNADDKQHLIGRSHFIM